MKLRHSAHLSVAAALLVVLSACGGGADRPSQSEIADALKSGDTPVGESVSTLPDGVVDCIASALSDSDLSDDALNAFVENDADFEGSSDDEAAMGDLTTAMASCASEVQ